MVLKLKYLWIYIMFAATIILMVIVGYVIVQKRIDRSVAYSKTLTYAGGQAALGYELANDGYLLSKGVLPKTHRWKLLQKLGEWNKVQTALQYGDGHFGLSLRPSEAAKQQLVEVSGVQKDLGKYIAWLSNNPTDTATAIFVQQNMGYYVTAMNKLSQRVQMDAEVDLMGLRREEKQLALISGIILLLEMALLVAPYHRKLLLAYNELKLRKRQIEVSKKMVEDLNNAQSLMIAGINAGVWDGNMVTGKERWSKRLYELLGYDEKLVKADSKYFIGTLVHPDDRNNVTEAAANHFKYHTPYKVEARVMTGSNDYKWFEIAGQAQWGRDGRAIRMSGSILDIDENVRYRRRLEYSDFMLGEVGKMAHVGGWEYDIAHNRIMWTKGMYDINEIDPQNAEVLGSYLDHYAENHQHMIDKVIKHTEDENKAYDEEIKLVTAKGNERWVRVIGKAQYDEKNNLTRVRGVYQDIHAKKLREIELEKIRQNLSVSNKTKDKLLSIIAHDLRSPLNNIKSLIELKSVDAISFDEFNNYLDDIKINISQVSDAMENMLQWAFTQKDGFKVDRGQVNMKHTASLAGDLYAQSLSDKEINFVNNASEDYFADADPNHVFLIMRNLLNNAVKFTPEKGTINIATQRDGNMVKIAVHDTGIGMTAQQLEQIKKNLALTSTNGTNGEEGTGLGLSFCFEIAEKDGGYIDVDSEHGKGSTFTLVLPVWNNEDGRKKISGSSFATTS
ncbi:MAG: hypothetical protein EOP51_11875 [Sphingobacteriales bacterium]|nr:MAG: hypothetical protein EOP51_11875 [Sphingobacteriales bacterium]